MTEFKRTVAAVDEIEQLVQDVLDSGAADKCLRLSELVGTTEPTIIKLLGKAAETDPAKSTYGPQMKEKVQDLGARWHTVETLAKDVLRQRGATVTAPPQPGAPSAGASSRPAMVTRLAPSPGDMSTYSGAAGGVDVAGSRNTDPIPSVTIGVRQINESRRDLAARAAEARAGGGSRPMEVDRGRAAGSSTPAVPAAPIGPVEIVERMDALLHLVHCVFIGHGYKRADATSDASDALANGPGPVRVRYAHQTHPIVEAIYMPVQHHLVVYASLGSAEVSPCRAAVQLGMTPQSVQAKVDYLLVCPLLYRHCLPTLLACPNEVTFGIVLNLTIPGLKKLGCTSRTLKASVFDDDIVWWRVLLSLPASGAVVEHAMGAHQRGEVLPPGTFRKLVRDEVARARAEAEEFRERQEAERRMRDRMRDQMNDPLRIGGPRRPQPGFPGGPGGFGIIGGDHDLMPGGGFMPGGFGGFGGGGRRGPYGGGGGFGF